MRIAFFGLPLAALLLHRDGHTIVHAAVCRKGALGLRRLRRVLGKARVSVTPRVDAAFLERFAAEPPDLVVSWFWTKRLPKEALRLAPRGALGVHPSLLPRHRGPDPYFWAIDAGDPVTGVTAHVLEEAYDTGAILAQETISVHPTWNAWTLAKKLDRPSLRVLRRVVAAEAKGEPYPRVPQDDARATEAPQPDDDLLELDWHASTDAIVRRVRAAAPWPGAFTRIGHGDDAPTVALLEVEALERYPRALEPGECAVVGENQVIIRTGDGAVAVRAARPEPDDDGDATDAPEVWNAARIAEEVRRGGGKKVSEADGAP